MSLTIKSVTQTVTEEIDFAESYAILENNEFMYIVPTDALTDADGDIDMDEIKTSRVYDRAVLVIDKVYKNVTRSRFF